MRISYPDIIFDDGALIAPLKNVTALSGLGNASYNIATNQMASGVRKKSGHSFNERIIEISLVVPRAEADDYVQFFTPRDIKLTFGDRYIIANCEEADLDYTSRGIHLDPKVHLTFACPDPRFYSTDTFSKNLAGEVKLFGWPWTSTVQDGFSFGYRQFNDETFFTNTGREYVGFRLRAIASRGDVSNITVLNPKTGERLTALVNMVQGDELLFSTVDEDKDVYFNGVSTFENVPRGGDDYWQLAPGDNLLQIEATNETNLDLWLDFQSRYMNALQYPQIT